MFTNLSSTNLVIIGIIAAVIYFIVVGIAFNKRILALVGKPATKSTDLPVQQVNLTAYQQDLLAPLLDKPANHPLEQAGMFEEDDEEEEWEMVDTEPLTLLKEAERVVELIQDVVDHIASYPANPEEVFTKIRSIVSQYTFFMDTEYYEAINTFVAVTVQRDCDLSLSVEDLQAMWYAAAA